LQSFAAAFSSSSDALALMDGSADFGGRFGIGHSIYYPSGRAKYIPGCLHSDGRWRNFWGTVSCDTIPWARLTISSKV
jgi:hypothetical protein